MFALEITFNDGVSPPETVYIRRPQAVIGASDFAHVAIDDMESLGFQLRLIRGLGRQFRCKPIGASNQHGLSSMLEGVYDGEAEFDLDVVKLHITCLDADLLLKPGEPPDRAGVRALRRAAAVQSPLFPAVVVLGSDPMSLSFVPGQPIYIGRSRRCALRLDSSDISGEHARLGYEGGEFWIEDLGSTNGTFVRNQQISGRVSVPSGESIVLGREVTIMGVTSEDQLQAATRFSESKPSVAVAVEKASYPVLLSLSEVARPARLVLAKGATVHMGRDPSNDMWVGAPHVSRKHCSVTLQKSGIVTVVDQSTNGTGIDGGVLRKGEQLDLKRQPKVLDLGGGVTVAVCFNEQEEQFFQRSQGSAYTFAEQAGGNSEGAISAGREEPQQLSRSPVVAFSKLFRAYGLMGKLGLIAFVICLVFIIFIVLNLIMPFFR